MKQRILICGLSLLLTFSLAGCGGQQAQQEPQDPDQRKVQQSEPASTTPPVESMEVNNENDTAKPLTELEDIEPKEADGAGILEGAGNAESDLEEVDPFTEVNETVYATGTVNLRSGPSTAHDKVGSLNKSDSVTRVGIGTADAEGWSRIQLSDGSLVYVSNKYLSTTKPVVQQQQTSKPSGGGSTTTQGGTQQPQQPSAIPGIDKPSGTPITGGQGNQTQQPSGYIPPEQIGDRTNPDLIESATKGMGGDLSGGHIEPWD